MPKVYILKAPSPDPKDRRHPLPVGCVLREADHQEEFFLNQAEAIVWRDILREQTEPEQWAAIREHLPGYIVAKYQDERGLETAFQVWQTYVALAWESEGAIPLPLTGRRQPPCHLGGQE